MITQRQLSKNGVGGEAVASRRGAVIDALKGLAKDPVFWFITAMILGHTFMHYATYIPSFGRVFWGLPYFNLHILHELEYLLIIAVAAYCYRWKGGALLILATLIASIPFMLTPYVFGYSPKPGEFRDRGIEVGATLVIGVMLTILVNELARKKDSLIAAVEVLQAAQKHLIESEETLREQHDQLSGIFTAANDGIFVIDPLDGRIVQVNQKAAALLEYTQEELMGMQMSDFHPHELERLGTMVELLSTAGVAIADDMSCRTHSGRLVPVEISASTFPLGDRSMFVAMVRDITERKRAEEGLLESEERFRTAFDGAPIGMTLVAMHGRVLRVNSSLCQMLGYSIQEMLGATALTFVHSVDQEALRQHWRQMRSGEIDSCQFEVRYVHKLGHVVWGLMSASVVKGTHVEPLYCVAQVQDVTERKRAEEERAQYAKELEEAFHDLRDTQQQLIQSAKLAAIGELVSGVAHELNNPLTGVWGTSQLIMRRDLDETLREDIGVIHNEAARAVKIVQNLLAFARDHKPEKRYASVNEALEKALELRAYEMRVSGIELETELQHDLPESWFDFNQMQQVFLNIVVNAEQAMTEARGRGRLSVRTQGVDGSILISFADDGPGIPKENLNRIFDPFFTTKEVGKGTGLGLSICYGIVQGHGGRLWVESEVGKGSTFTIEIPVTTEENQEVPALGL